MSTAAPNMSTAFCGSVDEGLGSCSQCCCSNTPSRASKPLQRVRRLMSTFCEVTQGVGDTWGTCPTSLQGIWFGSRRAGFRCWGWLSVTFSFLVVEVEDCRHRFCNAEFQRLGWRYSSTVVMSLFGTTTVYRTNNLSNRQFIEPTIYRKTDCRTNNLSNPTVHRTTMFGRRVYGSLSKDSL